MFRWISTLLDRIFAVLGALLFAQLPLFMVQYRHVLSGHVNELRTQVEFMRVAAKHSGKTLEQFINKFVSSPDSDFALQGQNMQLMVDRWHQLADSGKALDHASMIERPFVFFYHVNYDLIKETAHGFVFGIPFTIEGAFYALLGIIAGCSVGFSLRLFARVLTRANYANSAG
jgi:hypothetical protein